MKHPNKSLLIRGAIATALLTLGFARLSEMFDPLTPSANEADPVKLSGPIAACHLIDEPIKVSGPIAACHLIERPVDKVG